MKSGVILVNLFHPNMTQSRGCRAVAAALEGVEGLTMRDLYAEHSQEPIDAAREQAFLLDHRTIVFLHPFYWYSCPSLMKAWMDVVLEQGFAFPPGVGDQLNGKRWLSIVTTGGAEEAYRSGGFNNFTMSELLRPFQQTANLCGMIWTPPFVIHGVLPPGIEGFQNISDAELAQRAQECRKILEGELF